MNELFPTSRGEMDEPGYNWVGHQLPPENTLIDLFQQSHCEHFFNCFYIDGAVYQRDIHGDIKPVIGWTFDFWKLAEN